ncbi:MAG: prepilin peptidase [Nibricoccus sp.]
MSSYVAEISTLLPWFLPTAAFIFGAMIGSFLNVVIYRVPANKSIVYPGSHCACGAPIAWYDNIPIVSWFILRGRARCCGRAYSFRYPFIELLTGLLFLWCWLRFAPEAPTKALCGMAFISVLICATFIDLDHMIIPDVFTVWFGLVGLVLSAAAPALHGQMTGNFTNDLVHSLTISAKGLFIGSALVLWIAFLAEHILRKEAMGFGDVKFVGMIGAFCGWQGAVCSIFGGAVVGTVWFIFALIWQKISGRSQAIQTRPPEPTAGEEAPPVDESQPFNYLNAAALAAGVLGVFVAFVRPAFLPSTDAPFLFESLQSVTTALTGLLVGSGAVLSVGLLVETPFKKDWLPSHAVTFVGAIGAFSRWHEGWLALVWGTLSATIVTALIFGVLKAFAKIKNQSEATNQQAHAPAEPLSENDIDKAPAPLGFGMHVPFGPMLAIGALLYFLAADRWIDSYFAQFSEIIAQGPL